MENYLRRFRLYNEKESPELVHEAIAKSVPFEGTNLWILIFAIVIASLGLNVSSGAVVIGAMLISPLMGPIMGIGYSLSINDLPLLKKSLSNYAFAGLVGLAASTVYFLLSPIKDASPEIISRTEPNLYDVMIAFFGGLAGILAVCSKQKGNVIPGVAIATALMPPLCTAGFGLASGNWPFMFGAIYLYIINSVFISAASYLTVRYLNLPFKQFPDTATQRRSKNIVTFVTFVTLVPSIYFAYVMIKNNRFQSAAQEFYTENVKPMEGMSVFEPNIDAANRKIELFYFGREITVFDSLEESLSKSFSAIHDLDSVTIKIKNGFDDATKEEINENIVQMEKNELLAIQSEIDSLHNSLDSLEIEQKLTHVIYSELRTIFPPIQNAYIQRANFYTDSSGSQNQFLVHMKVSKNPTAIERSRIQNFLELKFKGAPVELFIKR